MKRICLFVIFGLPIIFGSVQAGSVIDSGSSQTAVVEFTDKTRLGDQVLLGQYYFEHDDSRMARGEPCMYIYGYETGKPGKLVTSFHCKPIERPRARDLIITVSMTAQPDVFEFKEIQFKGSTKGHLAP